MLILHDVTLAKSRYHISFPSRWRSFLSPPSLAEQHSTDQRSLHYRIYQPPPKSMTVPKPSLTRFIVKKVLYRPYPRPRVSRNRLIFFSLFFRIRRARPPPARRVAARAALVYRSTSFSSAPRDRTVVLRLALGASCAHIKKINKSRSPYETPPCIYLLSVLTACDTTDSMQFSFADPFSQPFSYPKSSAFFPNYRLVLSIALSAPYNKKYLT